MEGEDRKAKLAALRAKRKRKLEEVEGEVGNKEGEEYVTYTSMRAH